MLPVRFRAGDFPDAGLTVMRLKSTLNKATSAIKVSTVDVMVRFDEDFNTLINSQECIAAAEKVRTSNNLSRFLITAAHHALRSPLLADHKLAHIIELQMYFSDFLEQSKVVKAWGAIVRAETLADLAAAWASKATADHLSANRTPGDLSSPLRDTASPTSPTGFRTFLLLRQVCLSYCPTRPC